MHDIHNMFMYIANNTPNIISERNKERKKERKKKRRLAKIRHISYKHFYNLTNQFTLFTSRSI